MCKVSTLKSSERKLTIILKDGSTISTSWYLDDSDNMAGAVNCTEKEYALYKEILQERNIPKNEVKRFYISRRREEDVIYISDHAMERLKERNGWNKKTSLRMIQKVYDEGLRPEEIKGYFTPWIKNKVETANEGDEFILYGMNLYVFNRNTLVTLLTVPKKGSFLTK